MMHTTLYNRRQAVQLLRWKSVTTEIKKKSTTYIHVMVQSDDKCTHRLAPRITTSLKLAFPNQIKMLHFGVRTVVWQFHHHTTPSLMRRSMNSFHILMPLWRFILKKEDMPSKQWSVPFSKFSYNAQNTRSGVSPCSGQNYNSSYRRHPYTRLNGVIIQNTATLNFIYVR